MAGGFELTGIDVSGLADGPLSYTAVDNNDGLGEFSVIALLDTTAPTLGTVDLVAASDSGTSSTDDLTNDDTPTFEFTAETGADVDIEFGTGSGFVSVGTSTGAAQSATATTALADGTQVITVRATDPAGNATTETISVDIDTTADVGGDLGVTIDDVDGTLNETELGATPFTIAGIDVGNSATITFTDSASGTVMVTGVANGSAVVNLSALVDGPLTVQITTSDDAGNTATESDTSAIETVKPTITAISFDDVFIDESDLPGTVTLSITFSEALDPSVAPTISFPQSGAAATLTAPTTGTFSSGNTVYSVTYTLVDDNVELADVEVDVSGATDVAGNVMVAVTNQSSGTEIDTLVEKVSFNVNDPDPQEDVLPSTTTVQAQVVFSIDEATDADTTIFFTVANGGNNPDATAGVDFVVPDPDGAGPGTSVLGATEYTGSIVIPEGQTSVQLDIDIVPDLILEGDEDFTVSITGASIASGETVEVDVTPVTGAGVPAGTTRSSRAVTIEDNETGANVALDVVDAHAAEGPLDFPAICLLYTSPSPRD